MDVISYGLASKVAKQENDTRVNTLGTGIEGSHPHAKGRMDNLEKAIQAVTETADKLIVNDAVNILKANAKLNVVAATARFKHHNMIFEDFLDNSGIDASKSSGYSVETSLGKVTSTGATIVTTQELTDVVPKKAILVVEASGSGTYFISRDDGTTWEAITPETLFYFKDSISPQDNKLRIKAELPSGVELLNYGLTWT